MRFLKVSLISICLLSGITACSTDAKDAKSEAEMKSKTEAALDIASTESKSDITESVPEVKFPIRDSSNTFVTIQTDYGNMIIELYHDVAPQHADSFAARTKDGFYTGTIFHRIVPNFMIQGGDPTGTGSGNAGYFLKEEFSSLPHQDGTLSMARGNDPNSASCQFFVCLGRNQATESLDRNYTIFGQVIKGFKTLHAIGTVEVKPNLRHPRKEVSVPVSTVYIREAFISDSEGNKI